MQKRKITYIHLCILVLVIFINYFGSLANHFTYDDRLVISENEYFQSLYSFTNLFSKNYFKFSGESTYRVVVTISYLIDYKIWGLNSFGFHFTNLLLHLFVTFTLYFLLIGIEDRRESSVPNSPNSQLPFIATILFSVHPVHSEVINAIGFREDLLCSLFYVLSFYFFIKALDITSRKIDRVFLAMAIGTYILSLFSKEMGITLPFVLLLYYLMYGKGSIRIQKFILYLIPFIIVTLFYIVIRFKILINPPQEIAHYPGGNFINNILTMSKVFVYYIILLFFPLRLKIQYDFPASTGFSDVIALISIMIIFFIIVLSIYLKRYSVIYTFSILFFFIALLPVSNLIPIINFIAERYLYLPSIGFCLIIAYLIDKKMRNRRFMSVPHLSLSYVILIILLCFYSVINFRQNRIWKDDLSLWEQAVKDAPGSFRVRYNLGSAYRLVKDYKKATEEFEEAIKLNAQYVDTYSILAVTYAEDGRIEDAKKVLLDALKIAPDESKIYLNLANAFKECKEYQTAIDLVNRAIKLDHNNPQCYLKLGAIYGEMKDYPKAIDAFNKMIELDKNNPKGYYNLANALRLAGDITKAIGAYEKAIELNPLDSNSHLNLAGIYLQERKVELALNEFVKAKEINPQSLNIRYNLAVSYLLLNEKDKAKRELKEILQISPNYKSAILKLKEIE